MTERARTPFKLPGAGGGSIRLACLYASYALVAVELCYCLFSSSPPSFSGLRASFCKPIEGGGDCQLSEVMELVLYTSVSVLATGLGVLPLLLARADVDRWQDVLNGVPSGMCLAAAYGLARESMELSVLECGVGGVLGLVFIAVSRRVIQTTQHDGLDMSVLSGHGGAGARQALLFVLVMTVHSFSEGLGIGLAFATTRHFGRYITLTLAFHNIPEGLAVAMVVVNKSNGHSSLPHAAWVAILTSLPQLIVAVPAFLWVSWSASMLPAGLGFAAASMVYVALFDLLKEAMQNQTLYKKGLVLGVVVVSFLAMSWVQNYLDGLSQP
jgi:ZIP family zinc transporter